MFRQNDGGQHAARIERLEQALHALRAEETGPDAEPTKPKQRRQRTGSRTTKPRDKKKHKTKKRAAAKAPARQRSHTHILAPGHLTTTLRGSLYNTTLRALALVGKLNLHAHFFGEFQKSCTPSSARELLEKIRVYRGELEQLVFADLLFKEHQQRRTVLLKNRIARGDEHARAILNDPAIGDGRGNWRGDLNEALNVLYGARRPSLVSRLRNVRHLKAARLLFDRSDHNGQTALYLYPRKYYRVFRHARALAGE